MNTKLIFREESYQIIGLCMEIHSELGRGFNEAVYGDALEIEFNKHDISFQREVHYKISYKKIKLTHSYKADFVVSDKIILELKAIDELNPSHIKQTLNYLAASKLKLGLLINFGKESLLYKRILL